MLFRSGLRVGDRLAIHLGNRVEFIDVLLAAVKLGVLLVPVNILYREREIAHILGDAEPVAVVTSADLAGYLPSLTPAWDIDAAAVEAASYSSDRVRATLDGESPALIVYTSGTTGRSKGAVLTHNNCLANTSTLITCWHLTHRDRYLAVLPLFHVHGLGNGVFCWLASGSRMRLVERFEIARAAEIGRAHV